MGWYQDEVGELGDGPFDFAVDFLRLLSQEYVDDLGRKPKIEEIIRTLEMALQSESESIVEGGDQVSITIRCKARQRPRKQPIRPGDVFSISLPDGFFAYGLLTPQHSLVEIFRLRAMRKPSTEVLCASARMRLPFMLDLTELHDWRWRVVQNIPELLNGFSPQHFRIGDKVTCGDEVECGFIEVSSRMRRATEEESMSAPKFAMAGGEYFVTYLNKLLKDIELIDGE